MRKLVYHVAITLDGFIAGEGGSVEGFLETGEHVDDYLNHLQTYDTVVMGKHTYEFGYNYGLKPGDAPYPHMRHYIFSRSLTFEEQPDSRVTIVRSDAAKFVSSLKQEEGGDIYLCGGGDFAGTMLRHDLIDKLILKVNPVLFGRGKPIFDMSATIQKFRLLNVKQYDTGVVLLTYERT